MRILITIPHAFLNLPTARYGSETGDAAGRAASLRRCVTTLHQCFGSGHRLQANADLVCNTTHTSLAVVVCTAGDQHLVDTLPPGLVHHARTELHPRLLGFACQSLLKANLGRFDWYGYLEDDCEVADPLWFDKLGWFNRSFASLGALLQPNRFEVSDGPVAKLYIDGNLTDPAASAALQDITVRPRLVATAFGRAFSFRRVQNAHSGCFFADAAQMATLAGHPEFGHFATTFTGPLESAATLPILRSFAVYKPARQNADFLELRHLSGRVLDHTVRYTKIAGGLQKTVI